MSARGLLLESFRQLRPHTQQLSIVHLQSLITIQRSSIAHRHLLLLQQQAPIRLLNIALQKKLITTRKHFIARLQSQPHLLLQHIPQLNIVHPAKFTTILTLSIVRQQ